MSLTLNLNEPEQNQAYDESPVPCCDYIDRHWQSTLNSRLHIRYSKIHIGWNNYQIKWQKKEKEMRKKKLDSHKETENVPRAGTKWSPQNKNILNVYH